MIHSSAVVSSDVELGDGVEIGAYSIVEEGVVIGNNTVVRSHVFIGANTRIGANNTIYQFSSVGESPQDLSYVGEASYLVIGDGNTIRENCVIHSGTNKENNLTKIGNNNFIMSHCHIAHDCTLGDNIIMTSYSGLAGHVRVHSHANLGACSIVHQYCTIGSYSMSAINSIVFKDVPAYVMVSGNAARERGMNYEGMRRHGYTQDQIRVLRNAYKIVYRNGNTINDALEQLNAMVDEYPCVKIFADSIRNSKRGITR